MAKKKSKTKSKGKKKKANPVGRPLIIKSPKIMDRLVDNYIKKQTKLEKPLLITGLCLHLGLCSKNSFYEYGKKKEFKDSVNRARLLVECGYEENLHGTTPTGSIFALKNFGWTDKPEEDASTSAEDLVNALSKLLEAAPN